MQSCGLVFFIGTYFCEQQSSQTYKQNHRLSCINPIQPKLNNKSNSECRYATTNHWQPYPENSAHTGLTQISHLKHQNEIHPSTSVYGINRTILPWCNASLQLGCHTALSKAAFCFGRLRNYNAVALIFVRSMLSSSVFMLAATLLAAMVLTVSNCAPALSTCTGWLVFLVLRALAFSIHADADALFCLFTSALLCRLCA